jgi:hypothetical protein
MRDCEEIICYRAASSGAQQRVEISGAQQRAEIQELVKIQIAFK